MVTHRALAGSLGVRIRQSAQLRSRDKSSDLIPDNLVTVTGSWGDTTGPVSTSYESPYSFWVNWVPTRSNFGYNVSGEGPTVLLLRRLTAPQLPV